MRQRSDRTHDSTTGRRPFLAAAGISAAGLAALAGCMGGDDEGGDIRIGDGDDGSGDSDGGSDEHGVDDSAGDGSGDSDETGSDDGSGDEAEDDDEDSDSGPESVADADPLDRPVDATGVSWDDLGELEGELTIYSGRTRDQIGPVFAALEDEYDGLRIDRDYSDNDTQVAQLLEDGDATPADLFYSQDAGALTAVYDDGLVQELPEDVLNAVPFSYRDPDGYWTGVTGRVRSIIYNSDRLDETPFDSWDELPADIFSYAEDDRFEGIISAQPNSGSFRGFIQAMVDLEGEDVTRQWVRGFMEQDPQLYTSGNAQVTDVERGGVGDPIIALGNSYYAARLLNENPDSPIRVTFTDGDAGALFNVAGVAATNNVDDPELVAEFVRHLLAIEGQQLMMDANGEFPVINGVDYVGPLPGPDELNSPEYDLSGFDMDLQAANELLKEEGMIPR